MCVLRRLGSEDPWSHMLQVQHLFKLRDLEEEERAQQRWSITSHLKLDHREERGTFDQVGF